MIFGLVGPRACNQFFIQCKGEERSDISFSALAQDKNWSPLCAIVSEPELKEIGGEGWSSPGTPTIQRSPGLKVVL